jgi:hypothetical protein
MYKTVMFVVILCTVIVFNYSFSPVVCKHILTTTPKPNLFKNSLSNGTPVKVFVLAEGDSRTWRSSSLRNKYPNAVVTNKDKTAFPVNMKPSSMFVKLSKEDTYRNSRTAGAIINTMNVSLQYPPGWFLAFEDDAQLLDTCEEYVLPMPIPKECQFISIDPRGTHDIKKRSKRLDHNYMQSRTSSGYGTAGFWFTTLFAKHMMQLKSLDVPIDFYIYNLAPKTGSICFMSKGCVVIHNDDKSMRIWPRLPA